jgi:hypothetical protein
MIEREIEELDEANHDRQEYEKRDSVTNPTESIFPGS